MYYFFSGKSNVRRLIRQETFSLLKIERDPSIESVRDTKISTKLRIAFFVLYCTNQGLYRLLRLTLKTLKWYDVSSQRN